MLASWRKQVGKAEKLALAPKKRGPKPKLEVRQIQQLIATMPACAANLSAPN